LLIPESVLFAEGGAMLSDAAAEYLNEIDAKYCFILFEKAIPAGKLKRETISLVTHDRTPPGFSGGELSREIFDELLKANMIEQDGPEAEGCILFRPTEHGRATAKGLRRMSASIASYSDSSGN
jgi:hypothetical protein